MNAWTLIARLRGTAPSFAVFPATLVVLAIALSGCGNMKDQRNVRTYEPSPRAPQDSSAKLPPAHTVARDMAKSWSALPAAELESIQRIPLSTTPALLARGQERFNVYCAVCHGADGYGQGIVVRRGFPAPPSLHEERLRAAPAGHYFSVMTHGFGQMYAYADRIEEDDRWAVTAYIRALQRSQHASLDDVPADERAKLSHD